MQEAAVEWLDVAIVSNQWQSRRSNVFAIA